MLRTRLTLKPGAAGTKKLLAEYGSRLICVRYRYDDERRTRCKTVELVIEEIPWTEETATTRQSYAPNEEVEITLKFEETHLREAVKRRGGHWNAPTRTWRLTYAAVLALRLTDRIVHHPPAPRKEPGQ